MPCRWNTSSGLITWYRPRRRRRSYVLLRDTLRELGKVGLSRVVIRTREYLALVVPRDAALLLMLIRYPQELISADEYEFPSRAHATYRLGKRELQMARQLVESMSGDWRPSQYQDKFRARLSKVVAARLRRKGARVEPPRPPRPKLRRRSWTSWRC